MLQAEGRERRHTHTHRILHISLFSYLVLGSCPAHRLLRLERDRGGGVLKTAGDVVSDGRLVAQPCELVALLAARSELFHADLP